MLFTNLFIEDCVSTLAVWSKGQFLSFKQSESEKIEQYTYDAICSL